MSQLGLRYVADDTSSQPKRLERPIRDGTRAVPACQRRSLRQSCATMACRVRPPASVGAFVPGAGRGFSRSRRAAKSARRSWFSQNRASR